MKVTGLSVSSSCLDFLMVMDCNQQLGAKINPFPQSCSLPGHFVKTIETQLWRHYYEVPLVTCQASFHLLKYVCMLMLLRES